MPETFDYDRPSSCRVIDTPIDVTVKASESPDALAVLTGSTGQLKAEWIGDAREGGAELLVKLFKLQATFDLQSDGTMKLTVKVTPVNGDGTDTTFPDETEFYVKHPQNMDEWQTAAGRARQCEGSGGGGGDDALLFHGEAP